MSKFHSLIVTDERRASVENITVGKQQTDAEKQTLLLKLRENSTYRMLYLHYRTHEAFGAHRVPSVAPKSFAGILPRLYGISFLTTNTVVLGEMKEHLAGPAERGCFKIFFLSCRSM